MNGDVDPGKANADESCIVRFEQFAFDDAAVFEKDLVESSRGWAQQGAQGEQSQSAWDLIHGQLTSNRHDIYLRV